MHKLLLGRPLDLLLEQSICQLLGALHTLRPTRLVLKSGVSCSTVVLGFATTLATRVHQLASNNLLAESLSC